MTKTFPCADSEIEHPYLLENIKLSKSNMDNQAISGHYPLASQNELGGLRSSESSSCVGTSGVLPASRMCDRVHFFRVVSFLVYNTGLFRLFRNDPQRRWVNGTR